MRMRGLALNPEASGKLELELIHPNDTEANAAGREVYAHAMRASHNRK
jgi:hypothetical protein